VSYVTQTSTTVSTGTATITIPSGVQGQDVMFLFVASSQVGLTVAGWTLVDSRAPSASGSGSTHAVYRKVAAGSSGSPSSDVGATVNIVPNGSTGSRTAVAFVAWRGLDTSNPVHAEDATPSNPGAGVTAFTGPSVATTVDGCDILTVLMDKNSVPPLGATVPSGYTSRSSATFSSGSGVSDVVVASKAGGSSGNYGADTWNASITPAGVTVFTLALTPVSTTQVVRPTSDITKTNVTGVSDNTDLYKNVDENVLSLADWVEFLATGVLEVGLASVSDPGVDTGWSVAYVLGLGAGAASMSWTISLKQSTTVIESWTDTNTTDNDAKTHNLSSANIANIVFTSGAATNLRLKFVLDTAA
jgi:hypothetical protein